MDNPLFDSMVRLWENHKLVSIDESALDRLSCKMAKDDFPMPNWRLPVLPEKDDADFIQFLGVNTAINFCFTDPRTPRQKFSVEFNGGIYNGSMAMSACLMRAIQSGVPILSADFLADITIDEMRTVFAGNAPMPLLEERQQILREIGRGLQSYFAGQFINVLERCRYYAFAPNAESVGTIKLLTTYFPSFRDSWRHEKTASQLDFHKRAQLFLILYYGRAADSRGTLIPIQDIENVGPLAESQVFRPLHDTGVLRLSPALREKIFREEEIIKGGDEELELRALTNLGIARLLIKINMWRFCRKQIILPQLDYKLWTMAKDCKTPQYLTLTTAH